MAEVSDPEAIGSNMPINWPRILSAAEIIAFIMLEMGEVEYKENDSVRIYLDVVEASQPVYVRSSAWENVLLERISGEDFMRKEKNNLVAEEASRGLEEAIEVIDQYNRDRSRRAQPIEYEQDDDIWDTSTI